MTNRPSDEELKEQYKEAWDEWFASEDAELWDSTIGDGLEDEPGWDSLLPARNDDSGGATRRR
ncbi:hypothetical protein [Glycomyces dulcitolivorans]|uniref:hypothetical protein n=1 Tax=Glycomyces dulcitolivorans TaxID=2200759 RepID=UPI000DD2CE16|nr:hypothetical protein [Glycomyces dulcitolivorans]